MNNHPITVGVIAGITIFVFAPLYALRPLAIKIDKLLKQGATSWALMLSAGYLALSSLFQWVLYFIAMNEATPSWHDWYPIILLVIFLRAIEFYSTGIFNAFSKIRRQSP